MSEGNLSLLNKAMYYHDWYMLDGALDNFTAAYTFMRDYRRLGGTLCEATWKFMQDHLQRLIDANALDRTGLPALE